jgi:transcriptional regulator with XRE-family HTH domain
MVDWRAIGGRIRRARLMRGLTQVALATAIGVTRAHLTNVENGKDGLAIEKLAATAEELGTTVSWLLGEATPNDDLSSGRHRVLIRAFDAMNPDQQRAFLLMAESIVGATEGAVTGPSALGAGLISPPIGAKPTAQKKTQRRRLAGDKLA